MNHDYYDDPDVEFLSDAEMELLEAKKRELAEEELLEALANNFELGVNHLEQQLGRGLSRAELNGLLDHAAATLDEDFDVVGSFVDQVEAGAIEPLDLANEDQRVEHLAQLMDEPSETQVSE